MTNLYLKYQGSIPKNTAEVLSKRLTSRGISCVLKTTDNATINFLQDVNGRLFSSNKKNYVKVNGVQKTTRRLTKVQSDFVKETIFSLCNFLNMQVVLNDLEINKEQWPSSKNWPYEEKSL